jgi:hypothetical protein
VDKSLSILGIERDLSKIDPKKGRKGKKLAFFENKKLESFWNLGFLNLR